MFSFGGSEILIIAVIALLLFGPDKIPQFARTIGRFMREFNKYKDMMESTVRTEIYKAEREEPGAEASAAPVTNVTTEERIARAAAAANVVRARQEADAKAAAEADEAAKAAQAAADEAAARDSLSQVDTPAPGAAAAAPATNLPSGGDKEEGE